MEKQSTEWEKQGRKEEASEQVKREERERKAEEKSIGKGEKNR